MRSKWLIVALVVCLALNGLAVGFILGRTGGSPPGARSVDPTIGLTRLIRSLPAQRRDELAREGTPVVSDGELRRRIGTTMRELRQSQRVIGRALADEPFDADKLAVELRVFREHFAANQASNHQALVEILARLTPEERLRFLETMHAGKGRRDHPKPGSRRSGAP